MIKILLGIFRERLEDARIRLDRISQQLSQLQPQQKVDERILNELAIAISDIMWVLDKVDRILESGGN